MKKKCVIFFIGTTAEYIKLFPIIETIKEKKIPYKIILSGQNDVINTDIAKITKLNVDLQLSDENDIKKNAVGLFSWWLKTLPIAVKMVKTVLCDVDLKNSVMVVHGDTISTTLGAMTAKLLGMKSAHIEAGLRSKHLLTPFPEEIDRLVTSKIATYHFAPGEKPFNELPAHSQKFNTEYNTIIDALYYSKNIPCKSQEIFNLLQKEYCIFVCHRQENLMNSKLVKKVVNSALDVAKNQTVVFIMHQITKNTLISMNVYEMLENNPNIILMDRVDYFDFMKLLDCSQFVITDGGSNQEELSYLGKPTLIIRKFTERDDGLDRNVVISKGDIGMISEFIKSYKTYEYDAIRTAISPSMIIAEKLESFIGEE